MIVDTKDFKIQKITMFISVPDKGPGGSDAIDYINEAKRYFDSEDVNILQIDSIDLKLYTCQEWGRYESRRKYQIARIN